MADEGAESLSECIRRHRELPELSMRQVADLAGISNPYLSQIERGLREPSERVMDAIAETLKLSTETLYEQPGSAPTKAERGRARHRRRFAPQCAAAAGAAGGVPVLAGRR